MLSVLNLLFLFVCLCLIFKSLEPWSFKGLSLLTFCEFVSAGCMLSISQTNRVVLITTSQVLNCF